MCFSAVDEQDVKNIPQDEYKINYFSEINFGSKKKANRNIISRSEGECLTSCFGRNKCGKFSAKLKTSSGVLNIYIKLLLMYLENHEMIFVEPSKSEDRELMKMRNKGHNKPEVINMSVRKNTILDNTRDGLNTQSNNFSNNAVSNKCSIEIKRDNLCYYQENKACNDDKGIFSVGYSNGYETQNMKEHNHINEICKSEDSDQDILVSQSSNFIYPVMEKGNSERKWRVVYAERIYKSQTLHPCPTCGRKFNDEAALRHFPICLKGKEKQALALLQKQKKVSGKIPSNGQIISPNVNGNSERKEKCIFQRSFKKQTSPVKCENINSSSMSSNIPISEPKTNHSYSRGGNSSSNDQVKQLVNSKLASNKLEIIQSESIKKSARIWRKSGKEFGKSNMKYSLIKKNVEANANKATIPDVEPSHTWNGDKAFVKPTSFNYEFRSSTFQNNENISETVPKTKPPKNLNSGPTNKNITFMIDLDIIPENIPIKMDQNNRNLLICSPEKKSLICDTCGSNVKEDNIEKHLEFCSRIKRLESSLTEETSTAQCTQSMVKLTDTLENSQFCLFRNAGDTPRRKELTPILSLKCPCCITLLDLYKTN